MKKGYILVGFCVAGVLAGAWVYLRYRQDLRAASERVATGGHVIETECGLIEYGDAGNGPPVLVIHGAGGGYDQGLLLGSLILGEDFKLIAPSRFGYLNSPIPEDSSLEAQADAFACLLDALHIDGVTVVAISAGGPSGLQFALRHPERTAALVMASAISYTDPSTTEDRGEASINRIIGSDFIYWLAINTARSPLLSLLGVSKEVQAGLTSTEIAQAGQILEAMLPMSQRLDGVLLDQSRDVPRDFPLEQIKAPTLVIHARDDSLVDYSNGQHTAGKITGAEFMTLEDGGHFLLGRSDEIRTRIMAFLEERAMDRERTSRVP
ncbi:MAG: alpha/beta fold hydrolase [Anaerolineae bacterium]